MRRRYARAWVLMDRIHDAGDSGEILFKHLRSEHPGINAWFVLQKDTPDYRRLVAEGHADRLVAYGSTAWRLLMANCEHLLSSHADAPVIAPPDIVRFTEPRWRFTFLQHGVIKDDLSLWLNAKPIDLFVTSTVAEHASIAGDGSPYPFTTKETILSGLPRFDRLAQVGSRFPTERRDLVLVTPTWRNWLVENLERGSQARFLRQTVLQSDFVHAWSDLVRDEDLRTLCTENGLRLGLLAHPNLESLVPLLDLPDHVVPLGYTGADVQEYFARARVLVTDYSSIAFNAAYLERPVVYFQFDEQRVLAGGHVGRRGYFDYRRDGFGPVCTDQRSTVAAVVEAVGEGGPPLPEYAARIEATFPHRDGGCSERVVQAVLASTRTDRARTQVPTPTSGPGPCPDVGTGELTRASS